MKFEITQAILGVLVFVGIQRVVEIITNYFIKPNIPNYLDSQEKDAIRLTIEVLVISFSIFVIKKFC